VKRNVFPAPRDAELPQGDSNPTEEHAVNLNDRVTRNNFGVPTYLTFSLNAAACASSMIGAAVHTRDRVFRVPSQLKF
jgi:hypothetical protein